MEKTDIGMVIPPKQVGVILVVGKQFGGFKERCEWKRTFR